MHQQNMSPYATMMHPQQQPMQQQAPPQPQQPVMMVQQQQPSFIDRMVAKRRDFTKLLVLVLIVIAALAVHALVMYGIERMAAGGSPVSHVQAARIVYAAGSLLALWVLKTAA